jgi:hypothetical protein
MHIINMHFLVWIKLSQNDIGENLMYKKFYFWNLSQWVTEGTINLLCNITATIVAEQGTSQVTRRTEQESTESQNILQ